jgi:hypothetical protein
VQVLSQDDQAKQNGPNIMRVKVIGSELEFLAKLKTDFADEVLNEGLIAGQNRNREGKRLR